VTTFLQTLVHATSIASVYALGALGFVLVYKASRVLNFAQAAISAAGALVLASLVTDGGLGVPRLEGLNPLRDSAGSLGGWSANLVLAMVLAAVLGILVERIAVRPMIGQSELRVTVVTIGVSITLQLFVDRAPIARSLRIPWGREAWTVGDLVIPKSYAAQVAFALVAFGLVALFFRTRWGLALRAVASDQEVAYSQGMDVGRVFAIAWGMAAAAGTLAAVAYSMSPRGTGSLSSASTPAMILRALPVLVIGGWDSVRGALVAAGGVGLVQAFAGQYLAGMNDVLGSGYPTTIPWLLMVAVLLVRPSGLFGERAIRRV
jgi:branched-chain amino acid transport system permease protein